MRQDDDGALEYVMVAGGFEQTTEESLMQVVTERVASKHAVRVAFQRGEDIVFVYNSRACRTRFVISTVSSTVVQHTCAGSPFA